MQAPWQGDRHTNHSTLSYTCTHTCPWGVGHHHGTTCTRVRAQGTLACVLTSTAARCEGKGCKLLEREVTKSKEISLLENILKVRPLGLPEQCASRCCLSSTRRGAGSDNCLILPREESVDNAWAWPRCLPGGLSKVVPVLCLVGQGACCSQSHHASPRSLAWGRWGCFSSLTLSSGGWSSPAFTAKGTFPCRSASLHLSGVQVRALSFLRGRWC